jgi:hypothetical protein
MRDEARLIRLGGEWERANWAGDVRRRAQIEDEVEVIAERAFHRVLPYVDRGRNVIRRARGLPLLPAKPALEQTERLRPEAERTSC